LVLFTPFYYGGSCYFYCEHGTSVGGCDEHRVLKGAMSNKGWLGIALGVSGAAVMTLQPSAIQIHVGDLMALGASFGLAFMSL